MHTLTSSITSSGNSSTHRNATQSNNRDASRINKRKRNSLRNRRLEIITNINNFFLTQFFKTIHSNLNLLFTGVHTPPSSQDVIDKPTSKTSDADTSKPALAKRQLFQDTNTDPKKSKKD